MTSPPTPVDEVARQRLCGVGRTKLWHLIKAGEIATVKIGRRRFITDEAIAEFIERHTEAVTS